MFCDATKIAFGRTLAQRNHVQTKLDIARALRSLAAARDLASKQRIVQNSERRNWGSPRRASIRCKAEKMVSPTLCILHSITKRSSCLKNRHTHIRTELLTAPLPSEVDEALLTETACETQGIFQMYFSGLFVKCSSERPCISD